VLSQLEWIQFPNEHVAGKEIVPGLLGNYPDGETIFRVRTHVTVLYIQVFTLEIGQDASP
jgi:hypothetical protein